MENKKLFKRLFSGVLIGGLLLTSGGLVIAGDQTTDQTSTKPAMHGPQFPGKGGGPVMQDIAQDILDQLVAAGTITQEQADKLLALSEAKTAEQKAKAEEFKNMTKEQRQAQLEEQKAKAEEFKNLTEEERQALKEQQKGKKIDLFSQAVTEGIITEAEAEAIKEKIASINEAKHLSIQQNHFDALVAAGTITQEQADELLALVKANAEEQKAKAEEFKNLTEEERKALREEQKGKKSDLFSQAVSAGILTQAEADAINQSMKEKAEQNRQQEMQSKLDELVTQGTITSEQAAAIIENMSNKVVKEKPDKDKSESTTTRTDKINRQNPGERPTPFKDLVDNGTLTQDQADAVAKIMQPSGNRGGSPGGPGGRF